MIVLQIAILLTGNYGFFNLLAIVLCLPSIDDAFWQRLPRRIGPGRALARAHAPLRSWAAGLLVVLGTIPLGGTLIGWRNLPPGLTEGFASLAPFHCVNGYGLFARMTTERVELIVEGTRDGATWERYVFVAKPDVVDERPGQIAPHMPRLDWGLWFASLGHPSHDRMVRRFVDRLREAEPAVLELVRRDPFAGERPRQVRVIRRKYRFSSWEEHDRTGDYWVVSDPSSP